MMTIPVMLSSVVLLVLTSKNGDAFQHVATPSFLTLTSYRRSNSCSVSEAPTSQHTQFQRTPSSATALHVLPEIGALGVDLGGIDATIAVVSAVAGAAAQMPRLAALEEEKNALQQELAIAKSALTESEEALVERVNELETALFEIDREYEGQTARMKKKFDSQLKDELETLKNRLKDRYATQTAKLKDAFERDTDLQKEELSGQLRQDFLQEKLQYINDVSGNKRDQLSSILKEQANVQKANLDLEQALAASRKELEHMQSLANQRGWWPFGRK